MRWWPNSCGCRVDLTVTEYPTPGSPVRFLRPAVPRARCGSPHSHTTRLVRQEVVGEVDRQRRQEERLASRSWIRQATLREEAEGARLHRYSFSVYDWRPEV